MCEYNVNEDEMVMQPNLVFLILGCPLPMPYSGGLHKVVWWVRDWSSKRAIQCDSWCESDGLVKRKV